MNSKHSLNFTAAVGEASNPYAALQSVSGEAGLPTPYNPVGVPEGYIAEYVLGDPNPMLIQLSGHRQVTGFDLASGRDFTPEVTLQPHQQRVITERNDLQSRLAALTSFIDSELFDTLPKAEQGRLQRQKLIMIDYVAVLNERVAAW